MSKNGDEQYSHDKTTLYIPVSSFLHFGLVQLYKQYKKHKKQEKQENTLNWNNFVATWLENHYNNIHPLKIYNWAISDSVTNIIRFIYKAEIRRVKYIKLGNILPTYSPYIVLDSSFCKKIYKIYDDWWETIRWRRRCILDRVDQDADFMYVNV